jgi:hypothetical protein
MPEEKEEAQSQLSSQTPSADALGFLYRLAPDLRPDLAGTDETDPHPPTAIAPARARGRHGGRPSIKADDRRIVLANKLFKDKSIDVDDICASLKISKRSDADLS